MKRLFARLWLVVCLFLQAPVALQAQATESPIIVPSNASLQLINRSFPPPDDAGWTPVSLPDNWAQRGCRLEPQTVWYRFEFDVQADFEKLGAWADYLPYLYDGGEFFSERKIRCTDCPEHRNNAREVGASAFDCAAVRCNLWQWNVYSVSYRVCESGAPTNCVDAFANVTVLFQPP